jgi:hypothetical protein
MEHAHNKSIKTENQAVAGSLINNTVQNKAIQLQDNRPASILQRKKSKVTINDIKALENDTDHMGAKALQTKSFASSQPQIQLQKLHTVQNPVIQRTVLSKVQSLRKGGTQIVYYSTYDPSQEFENQFDAWRLDTRLANEHNNFDEEARYPTVFTHYNTDSHNVPPSVGKAGPHTVSHSSLSYRLSKKIRKSPTLKKLRDEQVVTVEEFIKLLETEAPKRFKDNQRERLIKDYKISYKRLNKIIEGAKENYKGEGHELLMRLIQLNPYTVYGKGTKVSSGRIKHKGERKEDDFETSIDDKAKFTSQDNYHNFKSKRKKLYKDSSDEEKEKDDEHKHKDKKGKSVSLSPMDVMILLGRTVRGALYIMNQGDWDAYELYKTNNPENKYPR